METWYLVVFLALLYGFVQLFIKEKYLQVSNVFCILTIIIFVGCRYQLGNDYDSYVLQYFLVDENSIYPEYTFVLLALFLREHGFTYQMMFMIYSVLTGVFFYKGLRNFTKNEHKIALAIVLYIILYDLFWNSMSAVRQLLACMLFFSAARYIIEQKICKYALYICLATAIHSSAIILLPIYFFGYKEYSTKTLVCIVTVGVIISITNLLPSIFQVVLSNFSDIEQIARISSYGETESNKYGLGNLFQLFVYYAILLTMKNYNKKDKMYGLMINMYTLTLFIKWSFYFMPPIARMSYYFCVFQVVFIPYYFYTCSLKCRIIGQQVLNLLLAIILLHNISVTDGIAPWNRFLSVGRIEYEANFNFWR